MSRFESDWLDLREPADRAARAPGLLAGVVAAFGRRESVAIADLGAGGGSTAAALAPLLGRRQTWRLFDHDRDLLRHAGLRLARLGVAADTPAGLSIERRDIRIEVACDLVDLAADPLPRSAAEADLVTASALFDLVSEAWLERFVGLLTAARRPLYAALTFDGRKSFSPPHPLDEAVVAAFNRHQRSDKGFGPALGPAAAPTLARLAAACGYAVATEPSPWRLGSKDGELTKRLVAGMAAAVAQTTDAPAGLDEWRAFREEASADGSAEVGHVDMLLTPPA